MSERSEAGPLAGRRIALLETREAERLGQMLREQGATVVSCPAVAIADTADPLRLRPGSSGLSPTPPIIWCC